MGSSREYSIIHHPASSLRTPSFIFRFFYFPFSSAYSALLQSSEIISFTINLLLITIKKNLHENLFYLLIETPRLYILSLLKNDSLEKQNLFLPQQPKSNIQALN